MLVVSRAWSGLIIAVRRCLRNVIGLMVIRDSWCMLVAVAGLGCQLGHWHGFRVVILESGRVVLLEGSGVNRRKRLSWHNRNVLAGFVVDVRLQRQDSGTNVIFL